MANGVAQAHAERRFLVFDGDGAFVASFASWDAAHAWSHMRAAEPLTSLPVVIEDRLGGDGDRRTWVVEPGLCRLTLWARRADYPLCTPAGMGVNVSS
jgi:hypothetical protein